jgi:hypothetical protein
MPSLPLICLLSGKSVALSAILRGSHAPSTVKPAARKSEFRKSRQADLGRPVVRQKTFRFPFAPDRGLLALSCPHRGTYASSRTLKVGCGGRGCGSRRLALLADGEVVWFWRSDAGAKSVKTLVRLTGDGGNQAWSPGRARRKPLKPLRREGRLIRLVPVVLPRAFFLHADHGCDGHPVFPAPSFRGPD